MSDKTTNDEHKTAAAEDPCAGVGPAQRLAYVWFLSLLVIGICLTATLTRIDRFNYDTKGRFLDFVEYKENRTATGSIKSERMDPRMKSELSAQRARLSAD